MSRRRSQRTGPAAKPRPLGRRPDVASGSAAVFDPALPELSPEQVNSLQRAIGNARVQSLLGGRIQRDPATAASPAPAPAAVPTDVPAPALSATDQQLILTIEVVEQVRRREADRKKAEAKVAATGVPDLRPALGQPIPDTTQYDATSREMLASVGLTRLPEDERADAKAQQAALGPFAPKTESLEGRFSVMFGNRLSEVTRFLLDRNEAVAKRERDRYKGDNLADVKALKDAAWELAEADKEASVAKSLLDAAKKGPKDAQGGGGGGDLAGDTIKSFITRVQKLNDLKKVHGQRFPILHQLAGPDYLQLSRTNNAAVAAFIAGPAAKVLKDIAETKDHLSKGELDPWKLERVRAETMRHLHIAPDSAAGKLVERELKARQSADTWTHLAEGALMIAVSLAAALPGLQLVGLAGAAALSAMSAADAYKQYKIDEAAAGSALDSAAAIGAEYPDGMFVALAICGAVVDAGVALLAFREVVAGLKVAKEVADVEKAVQKGVDTIPEAKLVVDPKTGKPVAKASLLARIRDEAVARLGRVLSSQKVSGIVQDVLKGVIGGKPFKTLDDVACKLLLRQHGNWKQLVEELLKSGPKGERVAAALQQHRQKLLKVLENRFGAKPLPDASVTAISDVDLNIAGRGAGARVLQAEAFMAKEYGGGWAEAYRMAFYTESSRLLAYRNVLEGLSEAEKAAYLKKAMDQLTPRITLLNEAKSLAHAGQDAAAAERVRERATKLGLDVAAVEREAARLNGPSAADERAKLLKEVDGLMDRMGSKSLSPAARQDLALEISAKQLEANFLSREAYIGPAAMLGAGKVQSVTEAFHGAHSQLEMLEHILHECGGDVGVAMREYEAYKYINRFSQFAMAGGIADPEFQAFANISEYVYRTNRMAQRAAGTVVTDQTIAGAGKGAGGFYIRPADTGVQPALSDETVRQLYGSFNKKANDAVVKLQKAGLEGKPVTQPLPPTDTPPPVRASAAGGPDSLPPTVRNPGADDAPPTVRVPPGSDAPPTLRDGSAKAFRIDSSTPDIYEVKDSRSDKNFYCRAWLNEDGMLQIDMRTTDGKERSSVLNILQIMGEINQKFGARARGMLATWMGSENSNILALNAALKGGLPLEKAVFKTAEGAAAQRAGFTQATILQAYSPSRTPGAYLTVRVHFGRPGAAP